MLHNGYEELVEETESQEHRSEEDNPYDNEFDDSEIIRQLTSQGETDLEKRQAEYGIAIDTRSSARGEIRSIGDEIFDSEKEENVDYAMLYLNEAPSGYLSTKEAHDNISALAGATIYASVLDNDCDITQAEVADAAGISTFTLRDRLRGITSNLA